ncbi:MAG: tetratricopeptide repeat protein [Planctomycetota bacterium]
MQESHYQPDTPTRKVHPDAADISSPDSGSPGGQFGHYSLERKLGQGGMGVVYLARDTTLNRLVALKIMLLQDAESVERFLREARAAAKLKHPNIIQVYEIGTQGKHHYFTMDYIAGVGLDELVQDKNKQPKQMAEIVRDIALALDYAHSQGIIHRDIKPSNILIDSHNKPYLTDFGLAKEVAGLERSLTLTGTIIGTPDYMSPEQARGEKNKLDGRSDIFSLGATFYYSFTGYAPFKGNELYEVMNNVINKEPITPLKLVPNLHRDLETICLKCLEKEPDRRYQTAQGLADDLNSFLAGEAISARPAAFMTRVIKKVKKHKAVTVTIAGAMILVVATVLILTIFFTSSKQIRTRAEVILSRIRMGGVSADRKITIAREALKIDPAFAEAWEELGGAYYDKKEYLKAVECYSKAIELAPAQASAYYKRGINLERLKNEEALSDYQKVVELAPDSSIGYYCKGSIDFRKRNFESALRNYNKAIELNTDDPFVYNGRAMVYLHNGRTDLALADWNRAIELAPDSAVAYYSRGIFYGMRKEFNKAIADFSKVIELDLKNTSAYVGRGNAYREKKQYEQSFADYTKAIELASELNPSDISSIYVDRGNTFKMTGELIKALADYSKAIELDPKNPDAFHSRGDTYILAYGNYGQAITDLTRAIKLNPDDPSLYFCRGEAFRGKREIESAINDYTKAIELARDRASELDPRDAVEAYNRRAALYLHSAKPKPALADWAKAIKLKPDNEEAYSSRGDYYFLIKEFDNAIADFTKIVELKPKDASGYRRRADAHCYLKEFESAIKDFNSAIELNYKTATVYVDRGWAYYETGNSDQAMSDFTQAMELDPKNAVAYNNRGMVYFEKKEINLAIADFTKAIEIKSDYVYAYYQRGRSYNNKNQFTKAIDDFNMVLKIEPKAGEWIYVNRGWAYYKKNMLAEALADYNKAIEMNPKPAESYLSRGLVFSEKGELDKAMADYTQAISINPKYSEAYHSRADVHHLQRNYKQAIADGEMFIKLAPDDTRVKEMKRIIQFWKSELKIKGKESSPPPK